MKVNYNAKTGDIIRLNNGMGCQCEFHVADTYPDGIKLTFGDRGISLTYEELKTMDAEFTDLYKFQDLSEYVDDPQELMHFIRALCGVAKLRHRESQDPRWVELEKQLRAILDS